MQHPHVALAATVGMGRADVKWQLHAMVCVSSAMHSPDDACIQDRGRVQVLHRAFTTCCCLRVNSTGYVPGVPVAMVLEMHPKQSNISRHVCRDWLPWFSNIILRSC